MVKEIGHFIGGKHVKGTSGRFADVFNPNTGEVQAKVALASPAELRAAVENAKAAQPEWAAKNPQVRARVMMRFLELARIHAEEIATLISMEHGKTIPDALGDLQRGVEVVEAPPVHGGEPRGGGDLLEAGLAGAAKSINLSLLDFLR